MPRTEDERQSLGEPRPHPLAIVLDAEGTEGKGKGHKAKGVELITKDQLVIIKRTFNPRVPIEVQGTVLLLDDKEMVAAVLPPDARRGDRGAFELARTDIQKVYMIDKEPGEVGLDHVNSGLEAEIFGFAPQTGEIKPMMNPGDAFKTALDAYNARAEETGEQGVPHTVEMTNNCVELTFPHGDGSDPLGIHEKYLGILKGLIAVSEDPEVDVIIAPMASIPHTRIRPQSI